jgi:AcrR family transcriptional regulator
MRAKPTHSNFDRVKKRRGGRGMQIHEAVMQAAREEIQEKGYGGVSHRDVASKAGVNFVTVYRRWPTRARLVADLFLDIPDIVIPVPDIGEIEWDLQVYLRSIIQRLQDPSIKKLTQAFLAVAIDGDETVSDALGTIWREHFWSLHTMLDRAIARGELPENVVNEQVIEAFIASIWFRAFVSRLPMDEAFVHRTISGVVSFVDIGEPDIVLAKSHP